MRTRIKICGITKVEDAVQAARLGADAIGMVFYDASPRHVSVEQAGKIVAALPPFFTTVALFVNAARPQIHRLLEHVPIDLLQFHGDEAPDECEVYAKPYIKAIHMKKGVDLLDAEKQYCTANGLLLDTFVTGQPGGTGERFDWKRVSAEITKPVILAGGLTAANVATAIQKIRPYAVDVSSGVESTKGIKDIVKVANFIKAVQRTENQE